MLGKVFASIILFACSIAIFGVLNKRKSNRQRIVEENLNWTQAWIELVKKQKLGTNTFIDI